MSDAPASSSSSSSSSNSSLDDAPVFLNREEQTAPLIEKITLSHDTYLFRFGLPTKETKLGLPVGKHFKVLAPNKQGEKPGEWNGKPDPEAASVEIQRSYTPTTLDSDLGHFDLVIKVYRAHERFIDGGKVSQYFESLNVGDSIKLKGPFGLIEYIGRGTFKIKGKTSHRTKVGMIAGGSGITPVYQVIKAALKDDQDTTVFYVLYANQTEDNILLRKELEELAATHPGRLNLWYTLDRPPEGWKYSAGFINEEMLRAHLPPAADDSLVLMCGPPPMINFACVPNLEKLGYTKANYDKF
eukprot:TRINITY_DN1780_c0_g1_i2.p1 TRINITY_DN1780_c0_g1~~TRINITY_DN1780_c0_g1_i2.p1  ORF type:complete len:299 (-),score=117.63 TRINITY_DN1780_c0_g1_i2:119-1015(-)